MEVGLSCLRYSKQTGVASTEVGGQVVESEVRGLLAKKGRLCRGGPDFTSAGLLGLF